MYIKRLTLFIGTFMGLMIPIVSAGKTEIKASSTALGTAVFDNIMAFMTNFMPYIAAIALIYYGIKYGFGGAKTKNEKDEENEDPLAKNAKRVLVAIIVLGLSGLILKVLQAFSS